MKEEKIIVNTIEAMAAKRKKKIVSERNCMMIPFLWAPSTFLMPVSFARCSERAVDRLM